MCYDNILVLQLIIVSGEEYLCICINIQGMFYHHFLLVI